jgi:excisionase family DNA binding protein
MAGSGPNGSFTEGLLAMTADTEQTLSVPEAGQKYFGLSRGASYQAAKRGDLPSMRIGRRVRVPVRTLEAMLDAVRPNSRGDHGGQ